MWILMKKTYSGPAGVHVAGNRLDLSERTLKQIRKDGKKNKVEYFEETVPPWEINTDKAAVEKHKAISAANDAKGTVVKLLGIINRQNELIVIAHYKALQSPSVEDAEANLEKIGKELDEALEKATGKKATEEDGRKAADLTQIHDRARSELRRLPAKIRKHDLEIETLDAQLDLLVIDLEEAADRYGTLAHAADIEIEEEFAEQVAEILDPEDESDPEENTETPEPEPEGSKDEPEPKDDDKKTATGDDEPAEPAKADDDAEGQAAAS